MKVRNSKGQKRDRLERDVQRFLAKGGEIQEVPSGTSGTDPVSGQGYRTVLFTGDSPKTRTDLSSVAASIDARKRKPARKSATRPPKRTLVYDDFGEPLRWVWKD